MCKWTMDWANFRGALLRELINKLGCSSFWLRLGRERMSKRNNSSHTCKSNGTRGLVLITIKRFGEAICFTTMLSSTMLFLLLLGRIPLWLLLLLLILRVLFPRGKTIIFRSTWVSSSMSTSWSSEELRLNSWAHKIPSQLGEQGLGNENKGS